MHILLLELSIVMMICVCMAALQDVELHNQSVLSIDCLSRYFDATKWKQMLPQVRSIQYQNREEQQLC